MALGAKLWLVRPLGFHINDRHLRRAGLDYWQHLDWEIVDRWEQLRTRLCGRPTWFFSKKATRIYTEAEFRPGDVLVFGSESRGLPEAILKENERRALRIPIHENARSLNLSVSVAVAAFEARRVMANATSFALGETPQP